MPDFSARIADDKHCFCFIVVWKYAGERDPIGAYKAKLFLALYIARCTRYCQSHSHQWTKYNLCTKDPRTHARLGCLAILLIAQARIKRHFWLLSPLQKNRAILNSTFFLSIIWIDEIVKRIVIYILLGIDSYHSSAVYRARYSVYWYS